MRLFIAVFLLGLGYGCTPKGTLTFQPSSGYMYLTDSAKVNPILLGTWKSIGNGYYLEAQSDSIRLYSYTSTHCYKERNDYLEGQFNAESQFLLRGDSLDVYLTDYGSKTLQLQAKKSFIRVNKLPEDCLTYAELLALTPKEQLALYLVTLQENFAFAERRKLEWEALYTQYMDSITPTSSSEHAAKIMGEIATLSQDQHTKVYGKDGNVYQYRVTPSALIVQEAFGQQTEIEDLDEYFGLFFQTNYQHISDSLLHGTGQKGANGQLEWGSLTEEMGYVNIHSFAGFTQQRVSRKEQMDSLNYHMQMAMDSFKDKDALVVDISFNFGGYDAAERTLASYFTDRPRVAYIQQVYQQGSLPIADTVWVFPSDTLSFTKPVYVLMTDISRSAAESFAMMMDAFPNVTLVGKRSLGILSGMLGKSIGPHYVTLSNQRLVTINGEYYEGLGVPPDWEIEVFPRGNIMRGHMEAVRKIVAEAGKSNTFLIQKI